MERVNFDELKAGQWVVLTEEITKDEGYQESNIFGSRHYHWRPDGQPLEVLAVDLPFVMVKALSGAVSSVDIRYYRLMKCYKKYVQAAIDETENRRMSPVQERRIVGKRRKKIKEKKEPRACPRCGTKMIERKTEGLGGWRKVCPECGLDKGPVESNK